MLFPSPLTASLAGGLVGLALLFGFNFFLYLGTALVVLFVCASGLTAISLPLELFGWVVVGGVVGALPFLAFLAIPGFLRAFVRRRITSILARGSTNLPLPAPWPWRPAPPQLRGEKRIRQLAYGALFVLLPAAPILTLVAAWVWDPVMSARLVGVIAAASLGAVCWHHAYSRADRAHLVPSMTPLLLMAALAPASSFALASLVVASIALTWTFHPQVQRRRSPHNFKLFQLGRLRIWMGTSEYQVVQIANELSRHHLANGGSLLALPSLVALYPILGRRAPVYDIYSVFPASRAEQERMLRSIVEADVRVAFIADGPLDSRDELRFSNTHPLVWRHLVTTMEQVRELPGGVHVFRERAAATAQAPITSPPTAM